MLSSELGSIDSHENIKMRLPIKYQQTFKKYFNTFFDGKIYLFGSRVEDVKKGDNIDLYLVVNNQDNLFQKKIDLC